MFHIQKYWRSDFEYIPWSQTGLFTSTSFAAYEVTAVKFPNLYKSQFLICRTVIIEFLNHCNDQRSNDIKITALIIEYTNIYTVLCSFWDGGNCVYIST